MAVCAFCKFGKVEDESTITCRRFPTFISKSPDDWCGEFVPVLDDAICPHGVNRKNYVCAKCKNFYTRTGDKLGEV